MPLSTSYLRLSPFTTITMEGNLGGQFCIFEKSHEEHNKLDYQFLFLLNFNFLQSFIAQNLMQIDNIPRFLLHVQNNYGLFFKHLFFLPNVHHSLSKLQRNIQDYYFFKN
jgi:hypothetical protein